MFIYTKWFSGRVAFWELKSVEAEGPCEGTLYLILR